VNESPDRPDTKAKVYEILKTFSTAMLVTIGPTGRPEARPMHVAQLAQESGEIWFITGKGGALASEIKEETVVLLAFQNENTAYLSLRGKARIVQDRARIGGLWKESHRLWFPGGPGDPDIALVAVDPIDAEYWDQRGSNRLEYLVEATKAYVKGEKPRIDDADQHAKTSL
jgi:general stress protein 26